MNKEKKNNKARKVDLLISRRLINLGSAVIFVVVLLVAYFLLASLLKAVTLPKIDATGSKMYTLSQETKDALKTIDKDIDIYILNFSNYDNEVEIIKDFERENSKIHVTVIPSTKAEPEISKQFGLEEDMNTSCAIVSCGEKYQLVLAKDMYVQYGKTSKEINLVEEKIINSIKSVTSENKKKVYIYASHMNHQLGESNISFVNDLMTYGSSVDLLKDPIVPEDCDLLVLPGLNDDLNQEELEGLLQYIKRGKNILVFQSNYSESTAFNNFQILLAEYNLKLEKGIIFDEELENNLYGDPNYLIEKTLPSSITNGEEKERYIFSINTSPIKYLENDNSVTYEVLCETSDKSFLRTELNQFDSQGNILNQRTKEDGEYQKEIIGIIAKKDFNGLESKMILFGSDEITVDVDVQYGNQESYSSQKLSYMFQNKLIVIDSVKYLLNNDEMIRVEKVELKPEYTGSINDLEGLRLATLGVSVGVIAIGLIVWYVRRKRI